MPDVVSEAPKHATHCCLAIKRLCLTVHFLSISINEKCVVFFRNFFYVHVGITNWLQLINIDIEYY